MKSQRQPWYNQNKNPKLPLFLRYTARQKFLGESGGLHQNIPHNQIVVFASKTEQKGHCKSRAVHARLTWLSFQKAVTICSEQNVSVPHFFYTLHSLVSCFDILIYLIGKYWVTICKFKKCQLCYSDCHQPVIKVMQSTRLITSLLRLFEWNFQVHIHLGLCFQRLA